MKITPYNIKKGIRYLKHYGWKEFAIRLKEKSEPEQVSYAQWYENYRPSGEQLSKQRAEAAKWNHAPKISILVPVYATPELFLKQMIESVVAQTYTNWELCIADATEADQTNSRMISDIIQSYAAKDKRIRYCRLGENLGIAENTNAALTMAEGEYIALLDHDDVLAENALYEVVSRIIGKHGKQSVQSGVHWDSYMEQWNRDFTEHGRIDLLYSDEDKVTEDLQEHYAPHLKPDFNLDLLRSNNYITHLTVVRTALARQVGGFRSAYDGAQDYDFILRCVEQANRIVHIPEILYHWRMHPDSTAANQKSKSYAFDAGQRALEAHLQRMEICGRVTTSSDSKRAGFYRVHYEWQSQTKELPLLSIIIPNKDEIASLNQCLTSIAQSSYRNYEVIIVENNSTDTATFGYYEQILQLSEEERRQKKLPEQIRVVTWESKSGFNYSAINNFGVSVAKGEFLVLLNNDIELLSKDWMEEFLGHCMRPEVAIAGARLYYPDNSIQHAGIVVGVGGHARGVASNMFVGTRRIQEGYLHKAAIQMDYSAVTAACMMIKRSVFEEVGGFTEELAVAFNDVDLCLKVRKKGYLVVYDPYVEAYHYESKSRGQEDSEEKVRRFQKEIEYMRTEWNDILRYGDPYYNPHFSRIYSDYRLG